MRNYKYSIISYLFILPAFLLVFIFLIIPVLQTLYYSFLNWDGIKEPVFIGFDNYLRIFSDDNFIVSFRNTIIWVIFTLIFPFKLF